MKPSYFLSLAILLFLPVRGVLAECSIADQMDLSKDAAVAFVKTEYPNAEAGIWYFDFESASSENGVNNVLVHLLGGSQVTVLIQVQIGPACRVLSAEINRDVGLWNYLVNLEKQKISEY